MCFGKSGNLSCNTAFLLPSLLVLKFCGSKLARLHRSHVSLSNCSCFTILFNPMPLVIIPTCSPKWSCSKSITSLMFLPVSLQRYIVGSPPPVSSTVFSVPHCIKSVTTFLISLKLIWFITFFFSPITTFDGSSGVWVYSCSRHLVLHHVQSIEHLSSGAN